MSKPKVYPIDELVSKEGVTKEIRNEIYPVIVEKVVKVVSEYLEEAYHDDWSYTEEINEYVSNELKKDPNSETVADTFEVLTDLTRPVFQEVLQKVKKSLEE